MAFTLSLPTIWSDLALIQLKKDLVFGSPIVCNHDYEGEIAAFGNAVKVHGVSDPTISAYTQDQAMSLEVLSDFEKTLSIDQSDSFNFAVDDIQTKQQEPKLMDQAMYRAGHQLDLARDSRLRHRADADQRRRVRGSDDRRFGVGVRVPRRSWRGAR